MVQAAKSALKRYAAKRQRRGDWPVLAIYTDDTVTVNPARLAPLLPVSTIIVIRGRSAERKQQQWQRWRPYIKRYRLQGVISLPWRGIALDVAGWHCPAGYRLPVQKRPIMATAHNQWELTKGKGADAFIISPLLLTRSHPGKKALGLYRCRRLVRAAGPVPVYPLGGINVNNMEKVAKTRCALLRGSVAIM